MRLIGLMSGTSVDGIDAACVEITGGPRRYRWRLMGFTCVAWEPEMRAAILEACQPQISLPLLTALSFRLGEAFAEAAQEVAKQAAIPLESIDAIASHGQTLWHQPTPLQIGGRPAIGTLQLGEPSVIATRTGCKVVADFRTADMALGGQGAPLVPWIDYTLFASPRETRAVQNIGGIANVTLLPAGAGREQIRAWDTGPGNMLLDSLVRRVTQGAWNYDLDGTLAAQGTVHLPTLERLLSHPYFDLSPPKSTGREEFGEAYATQLYQTMQQTGLTSEAMLATVTAFTAETIALSYRRWLPPVQTVILGGGGVHNPTLRRMLAERLPTVLRWKTHADFGLPDDAKEAVAFAFLAYETLHGRPSNLPSATGANGPALLGKITLPPCRR